MTLKRRRSPAAPGAAVLAGDTLNSACAVGTAMTRDTVERPRAVGINHVALPVGDIESAVDFYQSLFAVELRGRHEGAAFLDMGDQFVALMAVDGGRDGDGEREEDGVPVDEARHFGLVVDDADACRERLATEGVDLLETGGLDFHDPWGNRVQVVEYGAIQFSKADHVLAGMDLEDLKKGDGALAELAAKGMAPDDAA